MNHSFENVLIKILKINYVRISTNNCTIYQRK